jgi:hypothetical protein
MIAQRSTRQSFRKIHSSTDFKCLFCQLTTSHSRRSQTPRSESSTCIPSHILWNMLIDSCFFVFLFKSLTTNDIQRVQTDQWKNIHHFSIMFCQLVHQNLSMFVHDVDELLKDLEVESWCDDSPALPILFARRQQHTVAKPGLQ